MSRRNDRSAVTPGEWLPPGQLTPVGVAVGCVGCALITASSAYTALRMGSLPWPIIFTSVVSLVVLRTLGRTNVHEANVTQIVMSAGAMVAGGLAFTIPGAWMLGLADEMGPVELVAVALAGTLLGLVCTALIRRRLVEESDLEYPIGTAAAQTLRASEAGGSTGRRLFAAMGLSGAWAVARDVLRWLPQMLVTLPIPGVAFGISDSPMMLSVGFLVGAGAVTLQLAGGVLSNFGIVVGGTAAGLWSQDVAHGIVQSLGMGLMMGSGLGVVLRDVLPALVRAVRGTVSAARASGRVPAADEPAGVVRSRLGRRDVGVLALLLAAAALLLCLVLSLGPAASIAVVALTFVATVMSAQSVGQTGIDPMEVFGLIVLLAVAALSRLPTVRLFFVAGVVAVACGLAGDVMNDFKTGQLLGTSPRAMWVGQAIGALVGALVAACTMWALFSAYGPDAFGPGRTFVAAQASVVATMVSGIPNVWVFAAGLAVGIALYLAHLPSMMLGLGVYLPFYMTLSMFVGSMVRVVGRRVARAHGVELADADEAGLVVSSGLLGGESVMGVIIALAGVAAGLAGR